MLVVKCGGAAGVDRESVATDVAALVVDGQRLALVHGGSDEASRLGERLGLAQRFLTSEGGVRSRYTDAETIDVLTMAMAGHINPGLVSRLQGLGVAALGLSGLDGCLIRARRKAALRAVIDGRVRIVRDDRSGVVTDVNSELLTLLLDAGYLPVISGPALDPTEGPVNVDADGVAALVAVSLRAETLVILTNTPGLLRDPADPRSLVREVGPGGMEECKSLAQGRMKPKLAAAIKALEGGVGRVILCDGRQDSPIRRALAGEGTLFLPAAIEKGGVA